MGRVEVVLDAVVGATGQFFSNVSPLIAQLLVQIKNLLLFSLIDRSLVNVGVQVIVPPVVMQVSVCVREREDQVCQPVNLSVRLSQPNIVGQARTYLSRHCFPVLVRILNFSSSLLATKVHFLVPYSRTSSTMASSSCKSQIKKRRLNTLFRKSE